VIDEFPLRKIMGQHSPRAACPCNVEERVHDLAHVLGTGSSTMFLFGNERLHDRPLLVGQIRRVVFAHGSQYALSELFKHALNKSSP